MDLSAISGALTTNQTGSSSRSTLSREDFMNILISEMTNQDPMNPVDNQDFLAQLVQLENLEATSKLSTGIEALTLMQQLSSASSLIGRTVEGVMGEDDTIVGTVEKVVMNGNRAFLVVDGTELSLDRVMEVRG